MNPKYQRTEIRKCDCGDTFVLVACDDGLGLGATRNHSMIWEWEVEHHRKTCGEKKEIKRAE